MRLNALICNQMAQLEKRLLAIEQKAERQAELDKKRFQALEQEAKERKDEDVARHVLSMLHTNR